MAKIKVAVIGSMGKMGQEIIALVQADKDLSLVAKIDRGEKEKKNREVSDLPKDIDVVIDFSSPEVASDILQWCEKNGVALVSGTTGLSASQKEKFNQAAKKIAVLWEPNMSLGIAVLKTLLKNLGPLSESFDFQIEETHHRHKKDSPSGTAIALQEELVKSVKKKIPEPISLRAGGVFGDHRILALSESEVLEISHRALNRKVFAEGAVAAAKWLSKQKKGRYQMTDVLGL